MFVQKLNFGIDMKKSARRIRIIKNKRHNIHLAIKGNHKRKKKRLPKSRIKSKPKGTKSTWHGHGKSIRLVDSTTNKEFVPIMLLEYSRVFPGKTIVLKDEIKHFSREMLIKMVLVLGKNYGRCFISDMPDKPFFSYSSPYTDERIKRVMTYIINNHSLPDKVSYACDKTFLEFLKLVFNVKENEENNIYPDYIAEAKLFDLLLAINEQKVTPFVNSKRNPNDFSRMMYVSLYATNEFTNLNENLALSEQIYYAKTFFDFIISRDEYKQFYEYFLSRFGISTWKQYFLTLACLSAMSIKDGLGIINLEKNDPSGLLNHSVLRHISIDKNSYIENNLEAGDKNRDFSIFRSSPLIKMSDNEYMLYSKQLVIDRLYNSIYFDILPSQLQYKGKNYNQFYKELFVEKYLFDKTLIDCIDKDRISKCFPSMNDVVQPDFIDKIEEPDQPDFYLRENENVFIFECKAIKLNGDLKVNADEDEIMDELSNKLLLKRWKGRCSTSKPLKNPKPEGIGQLVNHIHRLENSLFIWDSISPSNLRYYPILVLESNEIVQTPLSTIANEWYDESIRLKGIDKNKCMPLIVLTIKTLFLYNQLFNNSSLKFKSLRQV